jgi:signal transduction histidine kinase
MGILLIFLISVDVLIVSKQRGLLMDEVRSHMKGELDLLGTFVREPLLKQEYSKVEQFLTQWAEEHDEIIALKATMPNDFVLLEYESESASLNTYFSEQKVQYAGKELIALRVVRDFSHVESILSRLQMQLITGSFILTFILGAVLWRTVKGMAMIPLEKEIVLRRESEDMLQKAKDELEVRVQERTRKLNDINQDLLEEIAERRRIEDALLESEEKYRLLVENTETGFVLGRSMIEWTAPESKVENTAAVASCIEGGSIQDFETVYLNPDGSRINILVNATMHETSDGKRLTALCRNITERKKIEKERELLNMELALKNRELEQIIYASSHDLRTPLVNIHGFSQELKKSINELTSVVRSSIPAEDIRKKADSIVETDIAESLKYITISVARMDSLLTGLLKLSRLGRDKLKIEQLDMQRLLDDVLSIFEFRLKEGNVKTEISDLPACMGDELQLNQVFSNLIENALKYLGNNKPGRISISGYKENGQSVYCVQDNGIGIEPEYREKIFEIFHQLEPQNSSGEGLGLTIVQRVLQRHNGKIWLESEPGTGSKFCISLPAVL